MSSEGNRDPSRTTPRATAATPLWPGTAAGAGPNPPGPSSSNPIDDSAWLISDSGDPDQDWQPEPDDATWLIADAAAPEPDPAHEKTAEGIDLSQPLPASGAVWPAPPRTALALDQITLPNFAPFATGLALSLTIVLLAVGAALNVNRFGINIAALGGKGPATSGAVVRAYLEAIGNADAQTARSYLATQPGNDLLLSNVVLQHAGAEGRLTVISVGSPVAALDGGQRVEAHYRVGDTVITSTFHTTYRNGSWRLSEDPGTLGVASVRAAGAKLYVNGIEIPEGVDSLAAFPGRYRLYTSNPYLAFTGGEPVLLVRGPSAAPVVGALRLVVTDEAISHAQRLTREAISRCQQQRDLAPAGCPQSITANANEPVVRESIRWKVEPSEPLLTVRPVPRSSLIEVTHTGKWSVTCDVIANGRRASLSPTAWTVTRTWVVDLTHRPLETRLSP